MTAELDFETLTSAQMEAYLIALKESHRICVSIYAMTASETDSVDISDVVVAGQIDLDATQSGSPMRSFSFSVLDPEIRMAITSPNSPAIGGLWAGSFIRVVYGVLVTAIDAWVSKTVFVGPIDSVKRDAQSVDVVCASKDRLLLPPHTYNNVFGKTQIERSGRTRRSAIIALLSACGEGSPVNWQAPNHPLPRDFNAFKFFHAKGSSYLALVLHIVGKGANFYYDGSGRPQVRKRQSGAVIDLTGFELTDVAETFDVTNVRNRARAKIAGKPTHQSSSPPSVGTVTEQLRPSDPLSAQSLERNGTPRFLDATTNSQGYKSKDEAQDAALAQLTSSDVEDATLDVIPVPFLEPFDRVKVQGEDGRVVSFTVKQFSLPLHVGDGMSLGYRRPLLDPKHAMARFRKHRQKHGH